MVVDMKDREWTVVGRVDWLAEYREYSMATAKVVGRRMTEAQYRAWVMQDADANQFYREIGEEFGRVKFIDANEVTK